MSLLSNETIELLNKKDENAFEIIFRLYYPRLVNFAKEYVSCEVAKGITQEAFIILLQKEPIFSKEYQLRSYLYTLVKNECLMYLRHHEVKSNFVTKVVKNRRNQIYESSLDYIDRCEVTLRELNSIIDSTLDMFSPRCREVFILSRYNGMKNREIANDLNISIKTVEAQITKAIKIFRVALKDFLPFVLLFAIHN